MGELLAALIIGNIVDTASTLYLLNTGQIQEYNPIMAYFYGLGWGWFVTAKVSMVLFCCAVFWRFRSNFWSYLGAWLAAVVYMCVGVYHLLLLLS